MKIKKEQDLVVNFNEFPNQIHNLLNLCKNNPDSEDQDYFCTFHIEKGETFEGLLEALDNSEADIPHVDQEDGLRRFVPKHGLLSIYEKGSMRNLCHIKLDFNELDDLTVKSTLERNLRLSLTDNEKILTMINEYENEVDRLKTTISDKDQAMADLELAKNQEIRRLEELLVSEKAENRSLTDNADLLTKQNIDLQDQIKSLKQKQKSLETDAEKYKKESDNMRQLYNEASAKLAIDEHKINDLEGKLSVSEARVKDLETKSQQLHEEKLQMTREKIGLENTIEKLESEVIGLKGRLDSSMAQIDNLHQQIAHMDMTITDIKSDKMAFITKMDKLEFDLQQASRDVIGYKQEIDMLVGEKNGLEVQLDKKIKTICDKERELRMVKEDFERLEKSRILVETTPQPVGTFSRSLERPRIDERFYQESINPFYVSIIFSDFLGSKSGRNRN